MVAVPVATPATTPVSEPIDATEGLLLVHTPPLVTSVSVLVVPVQRLVDPLIEATTGSALTVAVIVLVHPDAEV